MSVSFEQVAGLTKQRKAVFRVIANTGEHLTAGEIFDLAKTELPTISFATVYNSLRYLKTEGLIAEVAVSNGPARFDRITSRHDHAICVKCGRLQDLELEIPESIEKQAAKSSGFVSGSIEITLRGQCKKCGAND